jgi:hypothetical protein
MLIIIILTVLIFLFSQYFSFFLVWFPALSLFAFSFITVPHLPSIHVWVYFILFHSFINSSLSHLSARFFHYNSLYILPTLLYQQQFCSVCPRFEPESRLFCLGFFVVFPSSSRQVPESSNSSKTASFHIRSPFSLFWRKIAVGLWDHCALCVCVCVCVRERARVRACLSF